MPENVLHIENVTMQFGGVVAVNNLNLDVNQGEIVALIGPNGAGKTTLFNVISGVYQPTSGHIYLNDQEITNLKPYQISQLGFSRTFQNIRLFTRMNVLENVQMGMCGKAKVSLFDNLFSTPKKRAETIRQRERAIEILRIMGLEDKKYHMPGSLPYGEQRRLEIARAMATDPTVLLLDEPAAGMNEQETEELRQTISELQKMNFTIILIEHDMHFVMNLCHRLYVLNHGKMIAAGTPNEIKTNNLVIEAYLGKDVDE